MPALVIREAKPDDLAAVMAIEQASFAPGLRETLPTYRARLDLYPLGFLVAERAGRLLGFITAERWTETDGLAASRFAIDHHPALHPRADGEVLYFSALAVAPEARGLGTGAALLSRLIADHTSAVRAALLAAPTRLHEPAGPSAMSRVSTCPPSVTCRRTASGRASRGGACPTKGCAVTRLPVDCELLHCPSRAK